jgi:predicted nucleotidyltransferase
MILEKTTTIYYFNSLKIIQGFFMKKLTELNIDKLKHYFQNRDDIAFAFLYGSYAKNRAAKISDVDIAVYFYPENRHPIEYEEEIFYDGEDKIWDDLETMLNKDVELLVLNRAFPVVADSAIKGIPIVIKDWDLYFDFKETIFWEAGDFMDFIISNYMEKRGIGRKD